MKKTDTKLSAISVRVTAELKEKVEALAVERRWSINSAFVYLAERGLESLK